MHGFIVFPTFYTCILEWQCHNPWADLQFKLTFFFSKRAMRAIEKR